MYEIELYGPDGKLRETIELNYDLSSEDYDDRKTFSSVEDVLDYVHANHKFRCKQFVINTEFGNPKTEVRYNFSLHHVGYHRWGSTPSEPIDEEPFLIDLVESLADAMNLRINIPLNRTFSSSYLQM